MTIHVIFGRAPQSGPSAEDARKCASASKSLRKGAEVLLQSKHVTNPDVRDSSCRAQIAMPSPLICSTHLLARSSDSSGWLSSSNAQPTKLSPRTSGNNVSKKLTTELATELFKFLDGGPNLKPNTRHFLYGRKKLLNLSQSRREKCLASRLRTDFDSSCS